MRKVFVTLIALVLFLPMIPAAAARTHAAPLTIAALAAASFQTLEPMPANLVPSAPLWRDWRNAKESTISTAATMTASVDVDGRRLHFVRSYAHILWSPGVKSRGTATAVTQRTRAV